MKENDNFQTPPVPFVLLLNKKFSIRMYDRPERDSRGSIGYCSHDMQEIGLFEGLPKNLMAETLLHEIIHGMHQTTSIDSVIENGETSEEFVTNLQAVMICAAFRQNPEIFEWWKELIYA